MEREKIITRWERRVDPEPGETWGRLEVTVREPARGDGWERVKVDVGGVVVAGSYKMREAW